MSAPDRCVEGDRPVIFEIGDDLMDLCSQSVIRLALSGEILRWNAAARDLYGSERGASAGQRIEGLQASSDASPDQTAYAVLLAAGEWRGTLRRRTAAGAAVDVKVCWTLRLDEGGAPADIIEFGCAETAAEASARIMSAGDRYQQMFSRAPIALMLADTRETEGLVEELVGAGITDIAGYVGANPDILRRAIDSIKITEVNDQALQMFGGTTADDLVGPLRPIWQNAPETFQRAFIARFNGEPSFAEETNIRTLDGRAVSVLFSLTFARKGDPLGASLLGMLDITEQLETEAQLRGVTADFEHAARLSALGELTASIAHEIKQPLSAILTNVQTTQRWLRRETPNLEKAALLLTRVAASARRASDIIDRVQDAASNRVPEQAPLDLNDVVRESLLFVRQESDDEDARIHLELAPNLPQILGDRVQLQQVVVNLLGNSLQAMRSTATARDILITTGVEGADRVFLSTRDTGPGIAEADLDRVFDGFFTTKDDGLGIGLAICQSIVTAHGGTISAANASGGGACFCLHIPAIIEAAPYVSMSSPSPFGPSTHSLLAP